MTSSNFGLKSWALSTSGGTGNSSTFGVQNTTGQPLAAGLSQSENFGVYPGFQSTTIEEFPEWIPKIRLSSDFLDWGEVSIGHTSGQILTINNDGLGILEVTNISCDDFSFIVSVSELSIGGLAAAEVEIFFSPAEEAAYEATLTIFCNDTQNPELQIPLYGVGIAGCQGEIGDVTGDGNINVLDVLAVVNDILGLVPLDELEQCRADGNEDGNINVLDALYIVNIILGIIPERPAGEHAKTVVTDEAIAFLEALRPHFPAGRFEEFMALVKDVQVPETFSLGQNYPNPFNPETEIIFSLPKTAKVTLTVYNILGQVVEELVDSELEAGYHTVPWNGEDASSGVYFYHIVAGEFYATKRMVLMR